MVLVAIISKNISLRGVQFFNFLVLIVKALELLNEKGQQLKISPVI